MIVFLSSKADHQLHRLPPKMHQVLINKIENLGRNPLPPGAKKLVNRQGWRVRIGDYRILYTFNRRKNELLILSVAHRKEAYR